MKIWWQSSTPIHRLNDYRNSLTDQLNAIKRADTEIDINGVDNGSMDLHYNDQGGRPVPMLNGGHPIAELI